MPLVNLPDRLQGDFELLRRLEAQPAFFKQFTKLAHSSVLTGTEADASDDNKMFAAAAGKIGSGTTAEAVRRAVVGIAHVLVQCAKAGPTLSENDFMFSVAAAGLPRAQGAYLSQFFFLHASEIREHLKSTHK